MGAQDVDDIVGAMHRAVDPAARGPAAIARRRWDWDAAAEIVVNYRSSPPGPELVRRKQGDLGEGSIASLRHEK